MFYDVTEAAVQVLAVASKAKAQQWLDQKATPSTPGRSGEGVKDDLSRYLRLAEGEEIVITRHGRAAGVLIGFASEEDWFEYRLEHHPEFLHRIQVARSALQAGRGVRLEDVPK